MRPELNLNLKAQQFLDYYWLKEELISFCKENSISAIGSKSELTQRIKVYLETGSIKSLCQVTINTNTKI